MNKFLQSYLVLLTLQWYLVLSLGAPAGAASSGGDT